MTVPTRDDTTRDDTSDEIATEVSAASTPESQSGTQGGRRAARSTSTSMSSRARQLVAQAVARTLHAYESIDKATRAWSGTTTVSVAVAFGFVGVAAVLMILRAADIGPHFFAATGAILVSGCYAWALAARTGGRPVLFALLAVGVGVIAVNLDTNWLRAGCAMGLTTIAAVLAVMATVPAQRFIHAAREAAYAVGIGAVGSYAATGFEPELNVDRVQIVTLVLALGGAFLVVYRLGAGFHGLGRRGLVIVAVGVAALGVTLLYAELLRRYGTPTLVTSIQDVIAWMRDHGGGFPRPTQALIGVPALVWGTHMRARRRQGWWVCGFGVMATVPILQGLVQPASDMSEVVISTAYGMVVGLMIGYAVIRLDLLFTGPRGTRARRAEEQAAIRPEPGRREPLL